jgi:hypothetical protein
VEIKMEEIIRLKAEEIAVGINNSESAYIKKN